MTAVSDNELGRLIRLWRERRNYSQAHLADLAGISKGYVSLLETGERGKRPGRDIVIRLAQVLGAPTAELLAAAGRLQPGDEMTPADRMTFADFVGTDPALTKDQKETLIRVYRGFVGRAGK